MRIADINKIFTDKVNDYLQKGYVIYISSMRSRNRPMDPYVDLTNGMHSVRVWLEKISGTADTPNGKVFVSGYQVTVYRSVIEYQPADPEELKAIWTSELEIVSRDEFYYVGESRNGVSWYGSVNQAASAEDLRCQRGLRNRREDSTEYYFDKRAKKIVLPFVARKSGHCNVTTLDIRAILRYRTDRGKTRCEVRLRNGTVYTLS